MKTTKIPQITNELKSAVETYLLAKAYCETVRPVVEGYKRQILAENQFQYADKFGERWGQSGTITEPKEAWKMSDEDHARYCDLLDVAHKEHGFEMPEPGYCPLLMAENDVNQASKLVVNAATYITKVTAHQAICNGLDKYHEMVDLTVQFVLSACPDISKKSILAKVK